jgi:tetratricopeptide (TPR) repeat protein
MIQFAAIVIALMFALAPPSQAQDIYKDCNGGTDTVRIIDACSTVLERGSLEAASNRRSALFYRGYAYQRVDRLEEGFADYRASLVIDPGFFPSKNNLSVGLTRRGSEAYNNKNYAQARADFTETVELKPDDVQSLTNLAALDYKEGDFDQAISHCTSAIEIDPKATTAYDVCGRAYLGKGDLKNAVVALTNVQTLEPGRTDDDEEQNPQEVLAQARYQLAQEGSSVDP